MSDISHYAIWICQSEDRAQLIEDANEFVDDVPYIKKMFGVLANEGKLSPRQEESLRTVVACRSHCGEKIPHMAESDYVGEIGTKQCLSGWVFSSEIVTDNAELKAIAKFVTAEGNIIVYIGPFVTMSFEKGTQIGVFAEIASHDISDGVKVTYIHEPELIDTHHE